MNILTGKQKIISHFLKMIIFISAVTGTTLSVYAARDRFMGGRATFMFFTTQSNIAMALISIIGICLLCTAKKTGRIQLSLLLPQLRKSRRSLRIYKWSSFYGNRMVDTCTAHFPAGCRQLLSCR